MNRDEHAAWIASLKPGDEVECLTYGGTWEVRQVVECPKQYIGWGATYFWTRMGDYPPTHHWAPGAKLASFDNVRPIQAPQPDPVLVRDGMRITIGPTVGDMRADLAESKNAIALLQEAVSKRDAIIAELTAKLAAMQPKEAVHDRSAGLLTVRPMTRVGG